jgi:hypothetical protein
MTAPSRRYDLLLRLQSWLRYQNESVPHLSNYTILMRNAHSCQALFENKKALLESGKTFRLIKVEKALGQTRTDDRPLTRRVLYQLSYEGKTFLLSFVL